VFGTGGYEKTERYCNSLVIIFELLPTYQPILNDNDSCSNTSFRHTALLPEVDPSRSLDTERGHRTKSQSYTSLPGAGFEPET